jgi:LysM repeat protein
MAATRKDTQKIVGDSLDSFVQNLGKLFSNQLVVRNTEKELGFQEKVATGTLSLADQLAYRKQQLKDVSDDPAERSRLRGEIATLTTRVSEEKFTQDYAAKIADFQAGISSIDSVISFLTTSRDGTQDPTILDQIATKLADAQNQKFTITQNVIKAQSDYAVNSKAASTIDAQITKVTSARASAVLNGDEQTVATLDLQLQNLNQAKADTAVQQDVLNLGALSATGAVDAVGMLNALNNKISSADANSGPVTVGGTTYPSVAAFWTGKRDTYVSDQSSNGFFGSLDQELKNNVSTLASKNALTTDSLTNMTSVFNQLGARPELAAYTKQIDMYKQDVLQAGADKITDTITNTFVRDLNIGNAVAALTSLKALGVNVDTAYTKIIQAGAATKNQQVSNILAAAQTSMMNNPNLTPEAAISAAIGAGAGTVITPDQAVATPESKLATDAATTAAAGTGKNVPATTIPAPAPTPSPAPAPTPTPAPMPAPAASTPAGSYLIKSGDTLGAIAASHNTTVAALAAANGISNPNLIQAGATLKIPTASAPVSTPVPTPTPAPTVSSTTPATHVSTPAVAPAPAVAAPAPSPTYLIKSGDTLGAIAAKNGTTVAALASLNGISNPNLIQAGATIKLK